MGFIEKLGSGIPRVLRLLKEHGLKKPKFSESETEFTVTLYGPGEEFMVAEIEELLSTLNARQKSLQEYFEKNERLTISDGSNPWPVSLTSNLTRLAKSLTFTVTEPF